MKARLEEENMKNWGGMMEYIALYLYAFHLCSDAFVVVKLFFKLIKF